MNITTTKKLSKYFKAIIGGPSGIGKTPLLATLPKLALIDIDGGTGSISDHDITVLEVRNFDDLEEAYEKLSSKWGKKNFESIAIDSSYELVDIVLKGLKDQLKELEKEDKKTDKRNAYMVVAEETKTWIRKFRDLPFHFVTTTYIDNVSFGDIEKCRISFPGKVLQREVPGMFNEVFILHYEDDDEDAKAVLQCKRCSEYDCRDRSKTLKKFEKLDLSLIIKKMQAIDKKKKKK